MDTPISTFVKERRKMFNLTHADNHRRNLGRYILKPQADACRAL